LVLAVSDGTDTGLDTLAVEIITLADATTELIGQVDESNLQRKDKRPLIASLKAVTAAFDRGNAHAGLGQLRAFQNKVHAQIAPTDPALAEALIRTAEEIALTLTGLEGDIGP